MKTWISGCVAAVAVLTGASLLWAQPAGHKTRNVLFVMTDGLRWQEVFAGADADLMNKEVGGVADVEALRRKYWRETPAARRETLMPFLWGTIARDGQLFGNRRVESDAYVTNNRNFSYPGYNETLTGIADPRIDSNDKKLNPNITVLEWLHSRPAYRGKVAAFAAWDNFPFILNAARAGFLVNAGFDPLTMKTPAPHLQLLNQLKAESPRFWDSEPVDALTFHTSMEYLRQAKPRVMYLSLGETDEWAHLGKYDLYLDAAHRVDAYLRTLWDTVQAMPEYRNSTTLIFSPDHGRGDLAEWKDHGEKVAVSKYIWMGFLGPDTKAMGERSHVPPVTQNQIAATLSALLGEDYASEVKAAGQPIRDVIAR